MKLQLKNEWCEALRSGKYKQCKNVLSNGEAYCCLGVLAKVAGLEELPDNSSNRPRFRTHYGVIYDMFPEEYLKELGLREVYQDKLVELNDTKQKNFNEIADYIEEYVPCSD